MVTSIDAPEAGGDTMNESERLAEQLTRALNGEAWHGPSWREVLDGLGHRAAAHRPIAEGHTIAEVLLHATTWNDVVRRRLEGESPEVTESEDWPPAASLDNDAAWSAAQTRSSSRAGRSPTPSPGSPRTSWWRSGPGWTAPGTSSSPDSSSTCCITPGRPGCFEGAHSRGGLRRRAGAHFVITASRSIVLDRCGRGP